MTGKYLFLALWALILTASRPANEVLEISSSSELGELTSQSGCFNQVIILFHNKSDADSKSVVESFNKISSDIHSLPLVPNFVSFVSVDITQSEDILESQGLKAENIPAIKFFSGLVVNGRPKSVIYEKSSPINVAIDVITRVFDEGKRRSLKYLGLKYTKPPVEKKPGAGTFTLTENNFAQKVLNQPAGVMTLVMFFGSSCGHCKQLESIYDQGAKQIHGDKETYGERTLIAALDATVAQSLVQTYGIKRFPTILLFVGGKLKENYGGSQDAKSLIEFVKANLPPKRIESTFTQLTSFDDYEETCLSAPICVVSFVPSLYECDAKCRKGYMKTLQDQATGNEGVASGRGWSFFWLEGGSSEELIELEKGLGVGPGVGYPNLVVINGKKGNYASFRGSFSTNGLNEFFKGIIYGGEGAPPLYPLVESRKLLAQVKGAETKLDPEWDGKDTISFKSN